MLRSPFTFQTLLPPVDLIRKKPWIPGNSPAKKSTFWFRVHARGNPRLPDGRVADGCVDPRHEPLRAGGAHRSDACTLEKSSIIRDSRQESRQALHVRDWRQDFGSSFAHRGCGGLTVPHD